MFRIRKAQIEAFERADRADFEESLLIDLVDDYPEEVGGLSPGELQGRIHRAVDRALAYGIDEEDDVAVFVSLTVELGEQFDTEPNYAWAREILRDPSRDGTLKMEAVQDKLRELERTEAGQ
jgi:hypothetical protein